MKSLILLFSLTGFCWSQQVMPVMGHTVSYTVLTPGISLAATFSSTANCTQCASAAFSPAVGDLLVVFFIGSSTVTATPTVTDTTAEVTLSKITSTTQASGNTLYAYASNAATTTTTSRTIQVDFGADPSNGTIIHVYRVSNMVYFGTGAVRQYKAQASQAGGGTPGISFDVAALSADPIIGALADAGSAALAQPSGFSEGRDDNYSSPSIHMGTIFRNSGFSGTAVTWGASDANAFGDIVLELNNQIATPTFDNDTATYNNDVAVAISDTTSGAGKCYTTDGSAPGAGTAGTCDGAPTQTYSSPVSITATATVLKAIGTKAGMGNSAVKSATYTLTVANPISDVSSTGPLPKTVASCTGCLTFSDTTTSSSILYNVSTTGTPSDPACPSTGTTYSGALTATQTSNYKWIGCKSNYVASAVQSGTLTVAIPGAAPTFVQKSPMNGCGAVGSCTATLPGAATVGNTIILAFDFDNNGTSVTSVTHGADTGAVCGVVTDNTSEGAKTAIYVIKNIQTTGTGVTLNYTGTTTSFSDVTAIEYSGADLTTPCDATGSSANQGTTGTSLTPGAATPTNNFTMRIVYCSTESSGGPWTLTGGWNSRQNGSGEIVEDLAYTSASSQNPAITSTNTGKTWTCQQAALVGANQ